MSVVRRHLSTIGIGEVFLQCPPSHLLPSAYCNGIKLGGSFITPEILGIIKASPEDFIVREIASEAAAGKGIIEELRIAEIRTAADHTQCTENNNALHEVTESELHLAAQEEQEEDLEAVLPPIDVLKRILNHHCPFEADTVLASIQTLSDSIKIQVAQGNTNAEGHLTILIPPVSGRTSCLGVMKKGGDRGSFHRALVLAFPLLKSQTVPPEKPECDDEPAIRVLIDDTFFGLIPFLKDPGESIQALYEFRSRGCPTSFEGMVKVHKRRRTNNWNDGKNDEILLPFKLDLSKEQRRSIHHFFNRGFRGLDTATVNDYPINNEEGSEKTSALLVKWSKHAKLSAIKKAKSSDFKDRYILCVMRKRQREHLVAVQSLTRALRVRQSDIGIAGIKDMQAVTYQFVTIKNTTSQQVENANSKLRHEGIELSALQEVNQVIQSGSLKGNRFDIVVRDLHRIHVEANESGEAMERRVPCDRCHLEVRVKALRQTGFINYFGEQRLGSPGDANEVGVRSFDIGRAMLQHNFDLAVDLLMSGRLVCRGPEEMESPAIRKVRQTWKDSGRDASLTLECMPKMDILVREKVVLQGLRRYHNSLDALKCLHFNIRMFWINAYQSYIWNTMASERILRLGRKVVKGDLILDENGDVRLVNDSNISTTSFDEVVLPLPGHSIEYPQNEIGKLYDDLLKKEKVSFNKDAPPEATAKGAYRRLICRPAHVSADMIDDDEVHVTLVKLGFDLPSGSYATMLLRELMVKTVYRRQNELH